MGKKKILIVTDHLQYGGSDLVAVRLQQNLDRYKYECTYCVRLNQKGPMEGELEKTGVRIIHIPDKYSTRLKCYKYFADLFKKEHFDIIHCHLPFYSGMVMKAAKRARIKKRISHSHFSEPLVLSNSGIKEFAARVYRIVMRSLIVRYSTDIIGCSKVAGEYLAGKRGFRKKGIVLDNGISTESYMYDETIREAKRKELDISDKMVLGHIGQMYYVKNHAYLIDIFSEFQKAHDDSVLLLISDGPDRRMLEKKVEDLKLNDKVRFLGFRNDIPALLQAMDCFIFPSVHEGFPLTLIEAQISKLPCIVSDRVTPDVKLNDNLIFQSIYTAPAQWCEQIDALIFKDRAKTDNSKAIDRFEIKKIAKKLEYIYEN